MSDEFIRNNPTRWIFHEVKINLISGIAESLSSADETVHIFNCTKIPLKFALNKLSKTNGISNPSLVMTLHQFRQRTGKMKEKNKIKFPF